MRLPFKELVWNDGTVVSAPVIAESQNGWLYKPPQAKPKRKNETFGRSDEGIEAARRWLTSWLDGLIADKGLPSELRGLASFAPWYSSGVARHRWPTPVGDLVLLLTNGHIVLHVPYLLSEKAWTIAKRRNICNSHIEVVRDCAPAKYVVADFIKDPWSLAPDFADYVNDVGDVSMYQPGDIKVVPFKTHIAKERHKTVIASPYNAYLPEFKEEAERLASEQTAIVIDALEVMFDGVNTVKSYSWASEKQLRILGIEITNQNGRHLIEFDFTTMQVNVDCSHIDEKEARLRQQAEDIKNILGELTKAPDVASPTGEVEKTEIKIERN